ncbi:hypothetical protein INT48_005680 [Thamnidium elegans]|uniref:O-methyltransferase n=1 Tax=Thamnidium elegans TaxID=101142 RepID=A0A8H7SR74_9FUNG|nr:hypothetical protein INT48_005680 [Thamnidium elegans]
MISKLLLPSLTKIHLPGEVSKRFYSSFSGNDPIGNVNGRLRLGEEAYCNQLSTSFKQPYQTVIETITNDTQNDFDNAHMMVSKVQGKLLRQLVGILRPNKVLEIGGFTGSSAIAMGSALSPNASLLSLELDPKHIAIAERHVKNANLQDKVKFKQGAAGDSLMDLVNHSPRTRYDFIFLDADKGGYRKYYDTIMEYDLLTDHGVIVVDNVLFYGQVHKQANNEDDTEATKNLKKTAKKLEVFNKHVFNDNRVEVVMLPIFDGLSLIRKVNQ